MVLLISLTQYVHISWNSPLGGMQIKWFFCDIPCFRFILLSIWKKGFEDAIDSSGFATHVVNCFL
jgi:hypothetical protein